MPRPNPSDEVRAMLARADLMHEFACELKRRRGWRCSDRDAHARTLALFGEYGVGRGLWLDDALVACEMAGEDPVSVFFVEAAKDGREAALERELAELRAGKPGVRGVRRAGRLRDTG